MVVIFENELLEYGLIITTDNDLCMVLINVRVSTGSLKNQLRFEMNSRNKIKYPYFVREGLAAAAP